MKTIAQKEMHSKLTKAFSFAFTEAQKRGIQVHKLHWFQSEKRKDELEQKHQKQA